MYVMKDFKINNCRLCKKVFCCKICREKHETAQHKIFIGCEICIYGKTTLGLISQNIMDHIKTSHWPLHCLFCKRLFASVEELFQQHKCPLADNFSQNTYKSPYTPHQYSFNKNYCAHYSSEHIDDGNIKKICVLSTLATSTPMQREGYNNNLLEKIQEVIITPSDSLSNATKGNKSDSSSLNLKRKVTFCETPIIESLAKKQKISSDTGEDFVSLQFLTPSAVSFSGRSIYYTAVESPVENGMENYEEEKDSDVAVASCSKVSMTDNLEENKSKTNNTPSLIIHNKEMVWINVVNISTAATSNNVRDENSIDFDISNSKFFTPMVPKKKTNIKAPSSIIKKQEQLSIQFEGPVQISSTPNNSVVPVKSAPNVRDIFKYSRPSTSKYDMDNWEIVEMHSDDKFSLTENSNESVNNFNNSNSIPRKMWSSVTKLVKNVIQGFSQSLSEDGTHSSSTSLKRYYSDQDLQEAPSAKRYKVTDVQCRRNIRDITPIKTYMQSYRQARSRELKINVAHSLTAKIFVDKATQTDDDLFT